MRKDWWLIVILIVAFVLTIGFLFFLESGRIDTQRRGAGLVDENVSSDVGLNDSVLGSGGGGSGFGAGGEDMVIINGDTVNVLEFECGFYFEGYGVCAGTCPDGVCVSEGRSCYCKS
jgi:hypothetical protein